MGTWCQSPAPRGVWEGTYLKETWWKQMWPSREWLGMDFPPRSATLGSSVSSSKTRAPALSPRTTCGDGGGSTPSPGSTALGASRTPTATYLPQQDGDVGHGPAVHKRRGRAQG